METLESPPTQSVDIGLLKELRWLVEEFNYEYAAVLDRCEIGKWPSFFTQDGVYRLVARDNAEANLPLSLMSCEGMGMLKDRAYAIENTEMFAPRYIHHQITQIRVTGIDAGIVNAEAAYTVLETLIDEPTRILQCGRYYDKFVRHGDGLLLKERRCIYDTLIVPTCVVYPV
jgi:anthranilate 1,2-dioxygenase small subunit